METPEGYYTAAQAIEVLGIPRSTFFARVREGKIQKYSLPGYVSGLYLKVEIDQLAREFKNFRQKP